MKLINGNTEPMDNTSNKIDAIIIMNNPISLNL